MGWSEGEKGRILEAGRRCISLRCEVVKAVQGGQLKLLLKSVQKGATMENKVPFLGIPP